MEEFILDSITTELSKPQNIDAIVKHLMDLQNTPNNNSTLNILAKSKKQAELTLNNIMKAVEQGIINKATNKRMQELEQQIDELDKQMLVERSKTTTKINEQDIREFYKEALLQEPLILIDILVKEIKVFNDRFEITFNSPIIKSPDTKQGSFLTLKTKIKKYIQNKPITYTDVIIDFYI